MDVLGYILAAYGTTATLVAALVIATWWRARRVDQQLAQRDPSEQA